MESRRVKLQLVEIVAHQDLSEADLGGRTGWSLTVDGRIYRSSAELHFNVSRCLLPLTLHGS